MILHATVPMGFSSPKTSLTNVTLQLFVQNLTRIFRCHFSFWNEFQRFFANFTRFFKKLRQFVIYKQTSRVSHATSWGRSPEPARSAVRKISWKLSFLLRLSVQEFYITNKIKKNMKRKVRQFVKTSSSRESKFVILKTKNSSNQKMSNTSVSLFEQWRLKKFSSNQKMLKTL